MANLSILPIDQKQDVNKQIIQINQGLVDIQNWSSTTLTNLLWNFKETSNIVATPGNYITIPNYIANFNSNNQLIIITIALNMSGNGSIALVLNNQIVDETLFNYAGATLLSYTRIEPVKIGVNQIAFQWKSSGGTINKSGTGKIQIASLNS